MATPDYLQQVIVSGRRRGSGRANSARRGVFQRPSVTSLVWASLDMLTACVAAIMAVRLRIRSPNHQMFSLLPYILHAAPKIWLLYLAWFALALVLITRSFGLYGPIHNRSGLHELRVTVQATLMAGLLLCGALYLSRGIAVSRAVVVLLVLITAVLLCLRRAVWRKMEYSRYLQGLETRNVLIVGAGPRGACPAQSPGVVAAPRFPLQGIRRVDRARGGIGRCGCDRRCAQYAAIGALAVCGRDLLLRAGREEAGDRPGGRGAGARHRCARSAGSL